MRQLDFKSERIHYLTDDPVWGDFFADHINDEPVQWKWSAPKQNFDRPDGSIGTARKGWCYYRYWIHDGKFTLSLGRSLFGNGDVPIRSERFDFANMGANHPQNTKLEFDVHDQ